MRDVIFPLGLPPPPPESGTLGYAKLQSFLVQTGYDVCSSFLKIYTQSLSIYGNFFQLKFHTRGNVAEHRTGRGSGLDGIGEENVGSPPAQVGLAVRYQWNID